MKSSVFAIAIYCTVTMLTARAQEVSATSFLGNWDYKSPKGKIKSMYQFLPEKIFAVTTEYKGIETKTNGVYDTDRKEEIDRLKITTAAEGEKIRSQIQYYIIEFSGPDTVKLQSANDRQTQWRKENRKNTMVLVRQKEKEKDKEKEQKP